MPAYYLMELAFVVTLLVAASSFGWYLYRTHQRVPLRFSLRSRLANDIATVLVMTLVALVVVALADATLREVPI